MRDQRMISGKTEQEIWAKIEAEIFAQENAQKYDALIKQGDRQIELHIDNDSGGGFEGRAELTQISALVDVDSDLHFSLRDDDLMDSVRKFLGMQEGNTGYPELDSKMVLDTNARLQAAQILSSPKLRKVLSKMKDFGFRIKRTGVDKTGKVQAVLELYMDRVTNDMDSLHKIYQAFYTVLTGLEGMPSGALA
jgi:hypothetical protein